MRTDFTRTGRAVLVRLMLVAPLATGGVTEAQQALTYRLDLRLAPDSAALTGRAQLQLPPEAVLDDRVRLDVSLPDGRQMVILGVSFADGARHQPPEPDPSGVLTLSLPASAPRSLEVEYAIDVDSGMQAPYGYFVFAGLGPSGWAYPRIILSDGTRPRFMDFDVALTHPASLAVVTSGGDGVQHRAEGWVSAHYEAAHVEGFAIVAGEGFRVERHTETDVPVVAFFHPDYAAEFAVAIRRAAEAAAWYRRTYGFFPLQHVGIIQGHPRWSGGYPLPNMFAVHLGTLTDDFLAFITAHELGHYYWGLHVLGDTERLDWLQLALGIWSDQRYLAERSGRSLEEQWRQTGNGDWIADYLTAVAAGYDQRLSHTTEEENALIFDYNTLVRHGKGATGVYLQSLLLGKERFLELQRRILQAYRFRPLPVSDFVELLVDAGLPEAPAFFDAWQRGDAVIGLAVDEVVPEADDGWRVVVFRTGPVPYPITVELITQDGTAVRHTVPANVTQDTIRTATRPTAVQLDPDGIVPMWNSAHRDMRVLLARALDRGSIDAPFIALARALLADEPDLDHVRYRLARKLYWTGRWEEAPNLWIGRGGCVTRDACLAGLYVARSTGRLGRSAAAATLLDELRAGAERTGLGDFWQTVRDEIRDHPGR